jgi:hypothetical protein
MTDTVPAKSRSLQVRNRRGCRPLSPVRSLDCSSLDCSSLDCSTRRNFLHRNSRRRHHRSSCRRHFDAQHIGGPRPRPRARPPHRRSRARCSPGSSRLRRPRRLRPRQQTMAPQPRRAPRHLPNRLSIAALAQPRNRTSTISQERTITEIRSGARTCARRTLKRPATAPRKRTSPMMRWLRRWRERDDQHLFKASTPSPDIDPIDELARIVGDAQERDADDDRRFDDLARSQPAKERAASPPVADANTPRLSLHGQP